MLQCLDVHTKPGKDSLAIGQTVTDAHFHTAVGDGSRGVSSNHFRYGVGGHISRGGDSRADNVLTLDTGTGVTGHGKAAEKTVTGLKPDSYHTQALMVSICTLV